MGPHRLMMFCMKMAGMISYTGGPLLRTYSYYFCTSFLVFASSLGLYLYVEPKPIMQKLQTMHYIVALTQIFCKFLSIFLNQREVVDILKTIENLSTEALSEDENKEIIQRADRRGIKVTKIFLFVFCAYYPLRVTNLLLKYLLLRRPPQLFMQGAWIPPFVASRYILSIFYQVFTSLCAGFTNASYSIFIIFVTLQISAQIKILRRKLEDTSPLEPCIILHQKLIGLFLRVNDLLSGLMFVEIVLTSFYSCVCSFLIIQSLSTGGKEVVNHAHVLFLVLIRSFLICCCGNIIATQGEKLHNSAYFGNWFEKDKKYRQSVQYMLELTTSQPFKYNYRQIITMDMAQFMKVGGDQVLEFYRYKRFLGLTVDSPCALIPHKNGHITIKDEPSCSTCQHKNWLLL